MLFRCLFYNFLFYFLFSTLLIYHMESFYCSLTRSHCTCCVPTSERECAIATIIIPFGVRVARTFYEAIALHNVSERAHTAIYLEKSYLRKVRIYTTFAMNYYYVYSIGTHLMGNFKRTEYEHTSTLRTVMPSRRTNKKTKHWTDDWKWFLYKHLRWWEMRFWMFSFALHRFHENNVSHVSIP